MQLSAVGLGLIKRSEGFRSSSYFDPAGIATIGYGHRLLPGESYPKDITEKQAEELLAKDVDVAEKAITKLVEVSLTQGQFDALVDFVFNLGAGRLASSALLRDLNTGMFQAAAEQLLKWDHCEGHENTGLKARRKAEYQLWCSGVAASEPATA